MIYRFALSLSLFLFSIAPAHAASLDGKSYTVEFQAESATSGIVDFKDGMIVSPVHQTIMESEKEIYKEQGVPDMKLRLMTTPVGAPFTDQELDGKINFTGRIEGFPAIYWSGWVNGNQIEGEISVESFMGGYLIPFKGTEK